MTSQPSKRHTAPAKTEEEELREKGRDERGIDERLGQPDDGSSNHPETKETGFKSGSNAGQDLTSGDG
jgi:hypothetical protein